MSSLRESCHQLIPTLDNFSDGLVENLQQFIKLEDNDGTGTIWTCCIACLAHLAALCHLVSLMEPTFKDSMDRLFNLTLDKLGNLSLEVQVEEYSIFDTLTGVWTLVILRKSE